MDTWWLLILLGFLTSIITTMGGLGGGVFFVPIMVLAVGIPITEAREISLFVILLNSSIGAFTYYKQGRVSVRVGLIAAVGAILGSLTFKTFLSSLGNDVVRLVFGYFLVVLGVYYVVQVMIFYRKAQAWRREHPGEVVDNSIGKLPAIESNKQLLKVFPLFFLGGFLAAFFGVGGGVVNVPTLNIILGFPIHYATATSTFIIFFTSAVNVIVAAIRGNIDFVIGLLLAIGSIPGARVGAKLSAKIPKQALKGLLGVVVFFIGIILATG